MAFEHHLYRHWRPLKLYRHWRPLRPSLSLGRPWIAGPYVKVWWIVLLRAFIAIAAGALAMVWPHHALIFLVRAFGVFALLEGALSLIVSALHGRPEARAWAALGGATAVVAAAAALIRPAEIGAILVMAAGAWLIIRGAVASCESLVTRRERRREQALALRPSPFFIREEVCLLVDGVMSGVFGLTMVVAPHLGVFGLVIGLGAWAALHGALMIGYALELRRAPAPAVA